MNTQKIVENILGKKPKRLRQIDTHQKTISALSKLHNAIYEYKKDRDKKEEIKEDREEDIKDKTSMGMQHNIQLMSTLPYHVRIYKRYITDLRRRK